MKGTPKIIFVQHCPKDVLGETSMLKPLEELAYRRLMDLYIQQEGELQDDDERLSYATKTGRKWIGIKTSLIINDKIYIENGFIKIKRCEEQLEKAYRLIAQKSHAGKTSAQKRKTLNTNRTEPTNVDTCEQTTAITDASTDASTNHQPITVERHLTDIGRIAASKAAPKWDLYLLMRIYNQGVSTRGIPDNADAAFPVWCACYTKGKEP
jgi:uncharacterized protein YdaU (DUF1376 family)